MPESLLAPFTDAGVDLSGLRRGSRTTASELIYDDQGEKEIRYPTKAEPLTSADIPDEFQDCSLVYLCTMDQDVLLEDIPEVAAWGQSSAVDLGGYGGVHMSEGSRQAIGSLAEYACQVARHFTIAKASDEDARAIFGKDDPDAAAQSLLSAGVEVVVITAGPEGALVYAPDGHSRVPTYAAEVVDTTGCGDTFMAGFLCEFLRGRDPRAAARWGCGTAAHVIRQSGGVRAERMPTHAQVREIVEEHS
jgi:sugar/nucleoside kinase (ribokinase family)